MSDLDPYDRLRTLLAAEHQWPTMYTFKFIVPAERVDDVKKVLPPGSTTSRPSKAGRYIGLTASILMATPEKVIAIYRRAARIDGVISL